MKKIILIIAFLITATTLFAQNLMVITTDAGSTIRYQTSDITKITFEQHNCGESFTYEEQTYNTVLIGSQCWLKENLNVGTKINSTTGGQLQNNNGIIEKYCYDNDESNCDTYGGLYEWGEAMQYVLTNGVQGICPTGWHIPKESEIQTLKTEVSSSGNALKAVGQGSGGGAGNNSSGFSALLGGGGMAMRAPRLIYLAAFSFGAQRCGIGPDLTPKCIIFIGIMI